MNKTFDYNGVQIAPSKPVQKLRTVKKTLYIDSGDRDMVKYPTNGDFVLYLPRVYEKVVSLNVRGAEFPPISDAYVHAGSSGASFGSDQTLGTATKYFSFFLEAEGLNKSDEIYFLFPKVVLKHLIYVSSSSKTLKILDCIVEYNNFPKITLSG
jgi:hypothetical protein